MKNLLKRWWFWLLVALVIGRAMPGVYEYLQDRQIDKRADEWVAMANDATGEEFTPDEAVKWLREHSFRPVLVGSEHSSSKGKEEDYYVVSGWLELEKAGFRRNPAWLILYFRFTPDTKRFLGVRRRLAPYAPPDVDHHWEGEGIGI
jgi:hypothetical protein